MKSLKRHLINNLLQKNYNNVILNILTTSLSFLFTKKISLVITTHTSFKIISRPRIHCSRNSSHHISLIKITKSPQNTIKQMDIFPTLLDLTGIQSSWRGVGRSLLMSDSIANSNREKERRENAQKISDIIIHSDYFKTYQLPNKN